MSDPALAVAGRPPHGWFDRLAALFSAVGSIWIFCLMVVIVADVIGRSFLNSPIVGVAEIAGRSVVAIVFLQLASAVLQHRLTRADLLLRVIGHRSNGTRRALEGTFTLTAALVFALIFVAALPETQGTFASNEFFGVQGVFIIPLWPFRFLMSGGALLACVAAVLVTIRILSGRQT